IGFAVPSNAVRDVVPRLEQGKPIVRPYLGLATTAVPESDANSRGLRQGEGVLVQSARSGSPADRAGIHADDVITNIGGKRVGDPSDVAAAIENRSPGDQIEVEVVRPDGTRESVVVTLGRQPAKSP